MKWINISLYGFKTQFISKKLQTSNSTSTQPETSPDAMTQLPDNLIWKTENLHWHISTSVHHLLEEQSANTLTPRVGFNVVLCGHDEINEWQLTWVAAEWSEWPWLGFVFWVVPKTQEHVKRTSSKLIRFRWSKVTVTWYVPFLEMQYLRNTWRIFHYM